MKITNTELIKQLRLLRTQLTPFMNQQSLELLNEVEQRIPGDVSTETPAVLVKKPQQGHRTTKSQLMQKYLHARQK